MDKKYQITTIGLLIAIVLVIGMANRWLAKEMKQIGNNLPIPRAAARETVHAPEEKSGPRPIAIDPLNDPLAPVVQKPQSQSAPKQTVRPQSQQKVYEPSLESVILVQ